MHIIKMMTNNFTREDVIYIYRRIVKKARGCVKKQQWDDALSEIENASTFGYTFNQFFTDNDIESLLRQIAEKLFTKEIITNPNSNKCVFIDSFCYDNRGLTQQYLRAMMFAKMDILYICTADQVVLGNDIMKELKEYYTADILLFCNDKKSKIQKAKMIIDTIVDYSPKHIFLHITPWDSSALMACIAVEGGYVYNINLTDHAFWMGASFIDYNLEFRSVGMTISKEKRGLLQEQLLCLPYYPKTSISKEKGMFPDLPDDAVKVFTGGTLYKMLDKDNSFFHLMDSILEIDENVYILVAGFEKCVAFDDRCQMMNNPDRVIQIGIRHDIDDVFENCDIYLNTIPIGGGLMVQYAAKHKKPVLSLGEKNEVIISPDGILNQLSENFISYTNVSELINYTKRLINDRAYRISEGAKLNKGIMTVDIFNDLFIKTIKSHRNQISYKGDVIDYMSYHKKYLMLTTREKKLESFLVGRYGVFRSFFVFYKYWKQLLRYIDMHMVVYDFKVFLYSVLLRNFKKEEN